VYCCIQEYISDKPAAVRNPPQHHHAD
jgi:hypothetical protein